MGREKNFFEVHSQTEKSSKTDNFNLCVKNKWVITEMNPLETKLEDIFRDLTIN